MSSAFFLGSCYLGGSFAWGGGERGGSDHRVEWSVSGGRFVTILFFPLEPALLLLASLASPHLASLHFISAHVPAELSTIISEATHQICFSATALPTNRQQPVPKRLVRCRFNRHTAKHFTICFTKTLPASALPKPSVSTIPTHVRSRSFTHGITERSSFQ